MVWVTDNSTAWVFISLLGAAWNLEEDEEEGIASGSTDGVPFGYTTGGLYYTTDEHLLTLHRLVRISVKTP